MRVGSIYPLGRVILRQHRGRCVEPCEEPVAPACRTMRPRGRGSNRAEMAASHPDSPRATSAAPGSPRPPFGGAGRIAGRCSIDRPLARAGMGIPNPGLSASPTSHFATAHARQSIQSEKTPIVTLGIILNQSHWLKYRNPDITEYLPRVRLNVTAHGF